MHRVLLSLHVDRRFLLSLARLWHECGSECKALVKAMLTILEKTPHRTLVTRNVRDVLDMSSLDRHDIEATLRAMLGVDLPDGAIEASLNILWSFGLLDFEVYGDRILARTTRLWSLVSRAESFRRLGEREKVILALVSGLLFNTPANLVFKFVASGIRNFDDLYAILSSRVANRYGELCSKIERACNSILESLSIVDRPLDVGVLKIEKRYPYTGLNELILVGLSAIGSVRLNLSPKALTLKPPYTFEYRVSRDEKNAVSYYIFTTPEILALERDVFGRIQDYDLGISEAVVKALEQSNPYAERPEHLRRALGVIVLTLRYHRAEIERDLQLTYGL